MATPKHSDFSKVTPANQAIKLLNDFDKCKLKIAIQKDGELTGTSLKILKEIFGNDFEAPDDRQLISVVGTEIGILWAKNKSICKLVTSHAVDIAILGSDQILEDPLASRDIIQVKTFEHLVKWPLVLAVGGNQLDTLNQIKVIATQFPLTTQKIFTKLGLTIQIIKSEGSTEAYVYLKIDGNKIDAITDISVTGKTLAKNHLRQWGPALYHFYPVLIANPNGLNKLKEYKI